MPEQHQATWLGYTWPYRSVLCGKAHPLKECASGEPLPPEPRWPLSDQ